jgi:phage-related protein
MASKNQVVLSFAGDHDKLTKSFDEVGQAAQKMEGKVEDAGKGFDKMGDATDTLDTRAMGFRDTVTGVQDSVKGFSQVLKGDLSADSLVLAGTGVGDLASGFTNLLVPSLKSAVTWLGQTKVGMLAHAAAQKVVALGAKVWTGIQWLLNAALIANPIGLVVLAIVALVVIFVIAYKRSETFRKIVDAAFRGIVAAGKAVWQGIKTYFGFWLGIIDRVVGAVRGIPGKIRSAFGGLFNIISAPFRSAFNFVASAWNNTIGRLRWTVPKWVPFIGGNTVAAPTLPRFHSGGVVPGPPGSEMLAILQAGERVTPAGAAGQTVVLEVRSGGSRLDDVLIEVLARAVSARGGNVQVALGGARG